MEELRLCVCVCGFPSGASDNLPANVEDTRDTDVIPRKARSLGGGHVNLFQYSCWRIPWTQGPNRL